MKIELESTDRIITLVSDQGEIPARVWQGRTDGGIPIFALISRVAVSSRQDQSRFEAELKEVHAPADADAVTVFPLRMIL